LSSCSTSVKPFRQSLSVTRVPLAAFDAASTLHRCTGAHRAHQSGVVSLRESVAGAQTTQSDTNCHITNLAWSV
jgi:hypothetical protein